jgi:hypothetical protein
VVRNVLLTPGSDLLVTNFKRSAREIVTPQKTQKFLARAAAPHASPRYRPTSCGIPNRLTGKIAP